MNTSVKVIRFTSILSIILLVITYFITVNIESGFIQLNTIWISNNFLLTVFGGVLASTLVVLFCEISKYLINKKNTENQLFYQTMYLYQALFLMLHNILDYQSHPEKQIPENIFDITTQMIKSQVSFLQGIDYSCFKKNNLIEQKHLLFKKETFYKFSTIEIGMNLIRCAILEERINNNFNIIITSSNTRIAKILSDQINKLIPLLEEIGDFLKTIDDNCDNRYDWNKIRETTQKNYINMFEINKKESVSENTTVETQV